MSAGGRLLELCNVDDLDDGEARGFDVFGEGRDALFLIRTADVLKAYVNACPHHGASLPWRKDAYLNADGSRIVCSAHGAQFDIGSGDCLTGPALGCSLEPLAVRVDSSGMVQVCWNDNKD